MIKNILFDLDGTLTDPAEGITKSVAYALSHYGIDVDDITELNKFIGPPLADAFMTYFGFDRDKALEAISVYRERFKAVGLYENVLYDGIEGLLSELMSSGKRLILATSKPEVFAERILEHFMLDKYFSFVCGSLLDHTRTDKNEVIEYILSSLALKKEECVMVGDRMHDIIGGKKSQLLTVGVTYGYGSEKELKDASADHIVSSVSELKALLLTL